MAEIRVRSPRYPALALDAAIEGALKIYEREGLHPIAPDIAAQDMEFKDASNGAAKGALAALRSFGLLERADGNSLAVTKSVQDYKHVPDESRKRAIVVGWLQQPKVFQEFLGRYSAKLPSEAALRYEAIQRGFTEAGAAAFVENFVKSVDFAGFYGYRDEQTETQTSTDESSESISHGPTSPGGAPSRPQAEGVDRIPIRLAGGRRAWLEVPTPFYESDKQVIVNQVQLIVADTDAE